MAEFYAWPEAARLLTTFLLVLCVIAQTLALVLSGYRHPRSRVRVLENLLEMSVLFHIFTCTLLHGQMLFGYELGRIAATGYTGLRYAVFAVTALLVTAVMASIRKPWPFSILLACGLALPAVEAASGRGFAYIYLFTMLFWLLRSVHICMLRTGEIKTNLSALSIKNAIDALHSGVLFGETDGFILLSNRQMQRLMAAMSGRVRRSGWAFYQQLSTGDVQPGCQTAEFEGQIVCLLPDGSAWMFTKAELWIKGKTYIQLTASDITQRWNLTARLREQEDLLRQRSDELKDALANIHVLSRQRETQRAKMRAHDILGERLTLLLRAIRSEETLGHDVLRPLSQGLIDDLKAGQNAPSPQDELDGLRQAFASIGVIIEVSGALPEEEEKSRLFVEIIRESVTNAVRHGFATTISVRIAEADGGDRLTIANNGHPPSGPIIEGGGIGGMRDKVKPHGGSLDVTIQPQFVLTVDLPGGEADV